jgi:hypothetical protein
VVYFITTFSITRDTSTWFPFTGFAASILKDPTYPAYKPFPDTNLDAISDCESLIATAGHLLRLPPEMRLVLRTY